MWTKPPRPPIVHPGSSDGECSSCVVMTDSLWLSCFISPIPSYLSSWSVSHVYIYRRTERLFCSALQQLNALLFIDPRGFCTCAEQTLVSIVSVPPEDSKSPPIHPSDSPPAQPRSVWQLFVPPVRLCVAAPQRRASFSDHAWKRADFNCNRSRQTGDRSKPTRWTASVVPPGERGTDTGCSANIWQVQLQSTLEASLPSHLLTYQPFVWNILLETGVKVLMILHLIKVMMWCSMLIITWK